MSIGSFILIRNEKDWIGPHLASWLPHLDEMAFLDGRSTDGTLDIIKDFRASHPHGHKITLVEDRDPKNLREDYTHLFNEALHTLKTDWALFLHPDMLPVNPEVLSKIGSDGVAFSTHMRSFAGEPGGQLYEISGRGDGWKNIYRLRNPDLGAHYFGAYGAANEDVYFRDITGDSHEFHGEKFDRYPYEVHDSGLEILHFSDVRKYERRLDRMVKCLLNQGYSESDAKALAPEHPRVSLKDGSGFAFKPAKYPAIFKTWRNTLRANANV